MTDIALTSHQTEIVKIVTSLYLVKSSYCECWFILKPQRITAKRSKTMWYLVYFKQYCHLQTLHFKSYYCYICYPLLDLFYSLWIYFNRKRLSSSESSRLFLSGGRVIKGTARPENRITETRKPFISILSPNSKSGNIYAWFRSRFYLFLSENFLLLFLSLKPSVLQLPYQLAILY